MNEGTKLVELCVGRHEGLKASFTLSNGDSMLVDDLSGKDEAGWEEFVKAKGGPWELVAGWLQKHQLWRLLRDYESPNSKRPHLSVREGRETDSCLLCSPLFFFHPFSHLFQWQQWRACTLLMPASMSQLLVR